jgi:fucose 4-O-acetylase-like acetyltransferase
MAQRLNWIDWGKALAVITVVFCHLPQSQEWCYFRYLQACILTVFFFLSGYLKKDRGSSKDNWKYYWQGLILPYLFYNLMVYPYWLTKYYMLHGGMPGISTALKPVFGALLFEHSNAFCEPLNGPLWYLPAILFMHVTIDLCRKNRHPHSIMVGLCLLSVLLYAANKYWLFLPNLTPMGIMRRLPYYYIGYVMGRENLFRDVRLRRDLGLGVALTVASILLFHWHLQAYHAGRFVLHIALFYPVNLCFLFGMLYGCKALDAVRWPPITNISVGTLVIIGLHVPLISVINQVIRHLAGSSTIIIYQFHEATVLTLLITLLLYPVILFAIRHFPFLLGKKKNHNQRTCSLL